MPLGTAASLAHNYTAAAAAAAAAIPVPLVRIAPGDVAVSVRTGVGQAARIAFVAAELVLSVRNADECYHSDFVVAAAELVAVIVRTLAVRAVRIVHFQLA